jgi:hypothetical protein
VAAPDSATKTFSKPVDVQGAPVFRRGSLSSPAVPFVLVLRENGLVSFADRAAQNEELFRRINERIDEGAKQHGVEQSLPFHCECCDETCVEKIELPPAEYDRIAGHIARFVVIPDHERADVESVVEQHSSYLVVEKTGEARAEIEREHPRARHTD